MDRRADEQTVDGYVAERVAADIIARHGPGQFTLWVDVSADGIRLEGVLTRGSDSRVLACPEVDLAGQPYVRLGIASLLAAVNPAVDPAGIPPMTEEAMAAAAEQLAEGIIEIVMSQLAGDVAAGDGVQIMCAAVLGAFASLVAAAGGTREGAEAAVALVLPVILDDVFGSRH